MRPPRALLLAAGYGTRLRPLTDFLPKPVVPVLNEPLASYSLRLLAQAGVREVAINTHHLPRQVELALQDGSRWGVELLYSHEPEILGTGGAMVKLKAFLSAYGSFFVVNGDIICEPDLHALLEFHRRHRAVATMLVRELRPGEKYTALEIDQQGRLVSFKGVNLPHAGPTKKVMFCGWHVFEPSIFDFLPAEGYCCVNETAYPALLKSGLEVFGFEYQGPWLELGTLESYLKANIDLLTERVRLGKIKLPQLERARSRVLYGENVIVEPGAQLGPEVILGPDCKVKADAQIASCVVWAGSIVTGKIQNAIVTRDLVVTV